MTQQQALQQGLAAAVEALTAAMTNPSNMAVALGGDVAELAASAWVVQTPQATHPVHEQAALPHGASQIQQDPGSRQVNTEAGVCQLAASTWADQTAQAKHPGHEPSALPHGPSEPQKGPGGRPQAAQGGSSFSFGSGPGRTALAPVQPGVQQHVRQAPGEAVDGQQAATGPPATEQPAATKEPASEIDGRSRVAAQDAAASGADGQQIAIGQPAPTGQSSSVKDRSPQLRAENGSCGDGHGQLACAGLSQSDSRGSISTDSSRCGSQRMTARLLPLLAVLADDKAGRARLGKALVGANLKSFMADLPSLQTGVGHGSLGLPPPPPLPPSAALTFDTARSWHRYLHLGGMP